MKQKLDRLLIDRYTSTGKRDFTLQFASFVSGLPRPSYTPVKGTKEEKMTTRVYKSHNGLYRIAAKEGKRTVSLECVGKPDPGVLESVKRILARSLGL